MTHAEKEVLRLLEEHHFQLVRDNGHRVFRNPAGLTHILPNSGSDSQHGFKNNLHQLLRLLASGQSSHFRRAVKITSAEREVAAQVLRRGIRMERA